MTKRTDGPMLGLYLRVTPDMLDQIEHKKEKMSKEMPGANITLSDATRQVLSIGLEMIGRNNR